MKIISVLICLIIFWFSQVSADYKRNIDDEYKIYQLDIKIREILEKSNNWKKIKLKLQELLLEKIWKTSKEISQLGSLHKYSFKDFKEYGFIKIYKNLKYWNWLDITKLLENDFIKTIVRYPDLYIDEKSVYWLYKNETRRVDYIYFFETNKNQDIWEYVSENIFEEKYEWKCEFKEYNWNFIFTDNKVFSFQATEEYTKEFGFKETPDCWEFTHWYFERKSDNLIIFVKFTYEYVWLDYSLIETKY